MDFHQVTVETIRYFKEADISFLGLWYFKLLLRCKTTSQNIWFLNECLLHKVSPRYIKLSTNNSSSSARKGIATGQIKWIKEDRKSQYHLRDVYNSYLKVIHTQLSYKLHSLEFEVFDMDVRDQVNTIIYKKYLTQSKKLNRLISKPSNEITKNNENSMVFSDHKFYERFINLTNTEFSKDELNLLNKGFNYNIEIGNKNNLEVLGVETELALKNNLINPNLAKYSAANIIKHQITSNKHNTDLNTAKKIKGKSETNDLIFTRADKGKSVICIQKEDYIEKTLKFLDSDNHNILNKDPTIKYKSKINKAIDQSNALFDDSVKQKLKVMNPLAPKLYSLIKLHKPDNPIRPVVSFVSAPTTKISNRLITLITTHCNFQPKYSIKNSHDLINKIKDSKLPNNSKLISFDVTNLFPSIPPLETLELVKKLLHANNTNIVIIKEIIELLEICLSQNYFQFNNTIYTAKEGLIMGNPLSPLLAEIFMNNLEIIIHKHHLSKYCQFWHRYVDDILISFYGTNRQLTSFSEYINSIHPNIKFTIESENNNSINFLDLTIRRIDNKLDFSIYHKPSHTDITINNKSYHPFQHKIAAYNSMVFRLINVPMSKENFTKELNIIKQTAINNGFNHNIIDNILSKMRHKMAMKEIFPTNKEKFTYKTLTYIGKASENIKKFLTKHEIKISYKTNNNLGKIIKNNKDQIKKDNKSGVYKLNCGSCSKSYIGQTGRSFQTRIKDHQDSFTKNNKHSTYADHLKLENHIFNNNFDILHIEQKSLKLNLLESLEINKLKNTQNLLNDQLDNYTSPLLNLFNT